MKKEFYMSLAIKEAKKGIGKVSPNPMVGAVIVKENKIISKGYHKNFGGKHAEIVAIENAYKNNTNIEGCDLYVTLEPCYHYGKTPPCVDRVIKEKIKKVYIGIVDPNPKVKGKSIKKLRRAGIEVETGILEDKIVELNRVFLKYMTENEPYINIKIALTVDGFMADEKFNSKWISNEKTRNIAHELRNFYTSIMVGSKTVLKDNPKLTCRKNFGRNPIRIILDKDGLIKNDKLNIFNEEGKNIIFSSIKKLKIKNTEYIILNDFSPQNIINELAKKNIDSILIEGGSEIASQFLDFADRLTIFFAPKIFGNGLSPFNKISKKMDFFTTKIKNCDGNIMWEMKKNVYRDN